MSNTTSGRDDTGANPADEPDTTTPGTDAASDDAPAVVFESPDADRTPGTAAEPEDVDPEPLAPEPEPVAAEPRAIDPEPVASEPEPVAVEPRAVDPEPVPPELPAEPLPPVGDAGETDDDLARTARLDAAVERANAGAAASAVPVDSAPPVVAAPVVEPEPLPEPVAADSVRRETYVPASTAAVGAAAGAATLAPEPVVQQPQTIYVQAPVPPKRKGNRGFGALVAAIGAVAFALLYAGVSYLILIGRGDSDRAAEVFVSFLGSAVFWVPIVAVFVGFAVLAAIINRGPWWMYAVFGLLVGVFVYFAYIGAALLTVQAWTLTYDEAVRFIGERWLDPFAIAAAVIAREIPIWFGGWIAARGRTVTERNRVAREAYDRELAAGPKPIG